MKTRLKTCVTTITPKKLYQVSKTTPIQLLPYIRFSDSSQSNNKNQKNVVSKLKSKLKSRLHSPSTVVKKPKIDVLSASTSPLSRPAFKRISKHVKRFSDISIILCSHPDRLLKTYSLKTIRKWVTFLRKHEVKVVFPRLIRLRNEIESLLTSTEIDKGKTIVHLVSKRLNETFDERNKTSSNQHILDNSLVERCISAFDCLKSEPDPDMLFWSSVSFLGACLNSYLNVNKKKNDKSFGSKPEETRRIQAIFNRLQRSFISYKNLGKYLAYNHKLRNKMGKPYSGETIKDNTKTPAYKEWERCFDKKIIAEMNLVVSKISPHIWPTVNPKSRKLTKLLEQNFGFPWFRGKQYSALKFLLKGNLVYSEKTGIGKSLLYHLYSLLYPNQLVVAVDPTLALIDNQYLKAKEFGFFDKTSVAKLVGTVNQHVRKSVLKGVKKGSIQLLFLTPNQLKKSDLIQVLKKRGVGLLVLDEIQHIVYSVNYREEYEADFLFRIRRDLGYPKTLCMSATIDKYVFKEIRKKIFKNKENYKILRGNLDRPNLFYYCRKFKTTGAKNVFLENQLRLLRKQGLKKGVIYVATIRGALFLASYLKQRRFKKVFLYYSEMSPEEKRDSLNSFNKCSAGVMVATTSFGEGLDYRFIRFVFCYHLPSNVSELVQLFGRAGRGGDPSFCAVLVDSSGIEIRRGLINKSSKNCTEALRKILLYEFESLLETLGDGDCLRSAMLNHFDEVKRKRTSSCCSVCDLKS